MDLNTCYKVLGLTTEASEEEIRQNFIDLVKVWHPDRFTHDPKLQAKAQEKLKEINEAYQQIQEDLNAFKSASEQSSQSKDNSQSDTGPSQENGAEESQPPKEPTHTPETESQDDNNFTSTLQNKEQLSPFILSLLFMGFGLMISRAATKLIAFTKPSEALLVTGIWALVLGIIGSYIGKQIVSSINAKDLSKKTKIAKATIAGISGFLVTIAISGVLVEFHQKPYISPKPEAPRPAQAPTSGFSESGAKLGFDPYSDEPTPKPEAPRPAEAPAPVVSDFVVEGEQAYHDGRYEDAKKAFIRAIKLNAPNHIAFYDLGATFVALGDYQRAVAHFNIAIKLKPDFDKAYAGRAIAYDQMRQFGMALGDYKTAASLGNQHAQQVLSQLKISQKENDSLPRSPSTTTSTPHEPHREIRKKSERTITKWTDENGNVHYSGTLGSK